MDSPRGPQQKHAPKAEKTDLEMFLRVTGPELLRKHAANVVLGVLLIAAATMFLYTRYRNKAAEQAATNQNTAIAYDYASEARVMFNADRTGDDWSRARLQKARQVFDSVELVLSSDAVNSQKAAALLAKAEVLWMLGTASEGSTATTQAVIGFTQQKPAEYLSQAESTYIDILTKYPNEKDYAANALISLAAIDETRGDFAGARTNYQKVIDDKTLRDTYQEIATSRMKLLALFDKPYTLATPATAPSEAGPTSRPLMLIPPPPDMMHHSAAPTSAPMAEPTTAPTTAP